MKCRSEEELSSPRDGGVSLALCKYSRRCSHPEVLTDIHLGRVRMESIVEEHLETYWHPVSKCPGSDGRSRDSVQNRVDNFAGPGLSMHFLTSLEKQATCIL